MEIAKGGRPVGDAGVIVGGSVVLNPSEGIIDIVDSDNKSSVVIASEDLHGVDLSLSG